MTTTTEIEGKNFIFAFELTSNRGSYDIYDWFEPGTLSEALAAEVYHSIAAGRADCARGEPRLQRYENHDKPRTVENGAGTFYPCSRSAARSFI